MIPCHHPLSFLVCSYAPISVLLLCVCVVSRSLFFLLFFISLSLFFCFCGTKEKCPHSFQGMPIAPNKHKKCTCMPANNPYLQLNCFQGFFTVSKEKKTLPKCMVTVLWFSVALPLAWGNKHFGCPPPHALLYLAQEF
jgi:hypothetical protein